LENSSSRNYWPYTTPLAAEITIGEQFEMELVTTNDGSSPVTISEALHTYFNIGDIAKVQVLGLDGCDYIDKVDGGDRKTQSGPVTINNEVDRVYLDTQNECIINDEQLKRRIHIKKSGSDSTVVWNPWIEKADNMGDLGANGYRNMLCVESANAMDNQVKIEPGSEHRLRVHYSVEKV
jgi:glucose-6-phosphate 1-epimerase